MSQILGLSNAGTTEAQVIAIINGMVADSDEDGVTQPLTFDQAKQELLNFMLDTTEGGPALPAEAPAGAPCEWAVQAAGNALTVAHAGEVGTISLAAGSTDPLAPVYSGSIGGQSVTVTAYKGASASEIATTLGATAGDIPALRSASIAGAIDGEQDTEVTQHLANLPAPSATDVVAYRVQSGGVLEHGVPERGLDTSQMAMAAYDGSRDCVRDSSDVGAVLSTEDGKIIFANPAEVLPTEQVATEPYPDTSSAVRYRTFIPAAVASSGWICGKFEGDDRDFGAYYKLSNRTRASVFFNWPDLTVDTTKHVGTTHRLAGYGRSDKKKTASADGIKFTNPMIANTYGRIAITHSVGNPLCSFAGDITYNVVVEAWKSESVARISGTRVKVPAHEAYFYPHTEAYGRTIMKKKASKFFCLSINCGQETLWETSS